MTDQENPNLSPLFRRYGHRVADLPRIAQDINAVPPWAHIRAEVVAESDGLSLIEAMVPVCLTEHGFVYAGARYAVDENRSVLDTFEMSWGEAAEQFSGYFLADSDGTKWYVDRSDRMVPYLQKLWDKFNVNRVD